jgi:hypothetical protein
MKSADGYRHNERNFVGLAKHNRSMREDNEGFPPGKQVCTEEEIRACAAIPGAGDASAGNVRQQIHRRKAEKIPQRDKKAEKLWPKGFRKWRKQLQIAA